MRDRRLCRRLAGTLTRCLRLLRERRLVRVVFLRHGEGEIETCVVTCIAFNNVDPEVLVGVQLHVGWCGSGEVEEVLVTNFMESVGLLFLGFGYCGGWEDALHIYSRLRFKLQQLSGEADT